MTQNDSFQTFIISLVVLLLLLMVLAILYLILRYRKSRNLTVLRVSAGRSSHALTITTEPDHAHRMLDHLLDRVFLQVERDPQSGEVLAEEPGEEPGEEGGAGSESNPGPSAAASLPSGAVNTLRDKLMRWTVIRVPPQAPPSSSPPPTNQDQPEDVARLPSCGSGWASCSDTAEC